MNAPLDLEQFREAIGHNSEMERLLLRLFLETLDRGVTGLRLDMPAEGWEEHLHLIKGAALNARAKPLLQLLEQGKAHAHSSADIRAAYLETLREEQAVLHEFLMPHCAD